ncbi:MAG TPA: phosphoribosylformylglycinamidine synthase, purS protein [Candidatus Fraserbacteria bacterium]|nr:phosphoribosylformylglycinamidine synthase, purS protein [Candidatus Fraserbacteria bacterium]
MSGYLVKVLVEPRPGLLDPEGQAIERAIQELGLPEAHETSVGKLISFKLPGGSLEEVRERANWIGQKLLANPVIERFSLEVEAL